MRRNMRVVAVLVLWPAIAQANIGRRSFPGSLSAEAGGIKNVAIEHEELTFDLRPLADGQSPARISATYHLRADAAVDAQLVFVSGMSRLGDATIAFDGKPLVGDHAPGLLSSADAASLPDAWKGPVKTPALDGGDPWLFEADDPSSLQFALSIPPGKHDLVVTYSAQPQRNRSQDGGTLVWQLGYVLAPARDWNSFGGLDVSMQVPPGWRVAVSPKLDRTGDVLHASFPSLPADTIGITAQAATSFEHDALQIVLPILTLVVFLGGVGVMFLRGRRRGARWPFAVGWAIALAVCSVLATLRSEMAIPQEQSAYYGYGHSLGAIIAVLGSFAVIPIGLVIAAFADGGRNYSSRREPPLS